MFGTILSAVLNGLTWGLIIALVALGLTLIFGLLDIVNIAHGAFYMLGAVIGWAVATSTGNFLLALLVAPVAVTIAGVIIERLVIKPVVDDIPIALIVTFGVMIVLDELALLTFGPSTRGIAAPIPGTIELFGISYPAYRLFVAGLALLIMGVLVLFIQKTRLGLWMRAVEKDTEMADALGIPTSRVYVFTFGLGTFLAALSGVLVAPIVGVNYLMGENILVIIFIVVIVGGLGSFRGALLVSIVYALIENLGGIAIGASRAQVVALTFMLVLVVLQPRHYIEKFSPIRQ